MKKLLLFLIAVSLALPLQANVKWERFDFFDFAGGLNDGAADINLKDNQAFDLQNIVLTTSGNFKTRPGFTKVNSSSVGAVCTGVFFYKQADGDRYAISVWDNDTIKKMEYAVGGDLDGTWDDITGTLTFSAGQNDLAFFTVGEDVAIIEDGLGNTAPYQWNGAGNAVTLDASAPNAKYVVFHKNMCFAAGSNTNPSLLYFTDIGDVTAWDTGLSGNVAVETNDGSIIRGLAAGFDALYIWKDNSIWRLSGSDKDSFVLQRMVSDIGTLSGASISKIGNDFIFKSSKGDYFLYDGAVKVRKISSNIDGTIENLAFDRFAYCPSVVFEDDYYVGVTTIGGGTNNRTLIFDTFNLAWSKFKGLNANAMGIAEDATGKDIILFGDYSGYVYEYPSGTNDSGTAIDMFLTTKQFRFPEMTPEKYLKLLKVFANQEGNYNLTVAVRNDYEGVGTEYSVSLLGGGSSVYGTAVYGTAVYGGQNLIIGRIEPNKGKDFFQLKFSNENVDEPVEVKGFSMWLEKSDIR